MADTRLAKVGITVKEPWADDISYEVLDMTLYAVEDGGDGCSYVALRDNIGVTPGTDPNTWIKSTQAGQSIYDLAVKYRHFEGTEEEFEAEYQAVLQAARDSAAGAIAIETQVEAAEALRVAAETARDTAESARQSAETERTSAESARETDETTRQSAESGRVSNETARVSAEQERASAESGRVSAEAVRSAAEADRVSDFSALKTDMETAIGQADAATAAAVATNNQIQTAEAGRVSSEQGRVSAENARASAESARATAESGRKTAETARATAESARQTAETARASAETTRASAESLRVSAESGRVSAEQSRVSAESSRESQSIIDHSRAESDHAIAAEDHATLDEKIAHKADSDGYYEQMGVGIAKNLEGRSGVTDSFLERTTGGDAEVANGLAQMTEVAGKSQVWNQLVQNDFSQSSNYGAMGGSSVSYTGGKLDFLIVGSGSSNAGYIKTDDFIQGHKYYTRFIGDYSGITYVKLGGSSAGAAGSTWSPLALFNKIITASVSTTHNYSRLWFWSTEKSASITFKCIEIFDLTLLGIDNLTTVEEVVAWLAQNIGLREYYQHNAGEVLNNKMKGIESIGFNLLDPSTGIARIIGAYSDVYGNYYGITGTHGMLTFTSDLGETSEITPDSDGKFLLENPGWLDVATPGADCAVFLWWDGTRTEFEEYDREVANLDVTHIYGKLNGEGSLVQAWPTGMPGIGDVKDVLRVENGAVVARRRVGERAYASGDESDSSVVTDSRNLTYYVLATEQVYTDLVYQGSDLFADGTPVTLPVPYIVNNWGLERVIPQNPAEGPITSAPEIFVKYGVDAVEQLDTIRTSGVFVEDLKANLQALLAVLNDKLETAMGGTIAIGATPTDKVYPFTFIPAPEPEPTNEGE